MVRALQLHFTSTPNNQWILPMSNILNSDFNSSFDWRRRVFELAAKERSSTDYCHNNNDNLQPIWRLCSTPQHNKCTQTWRMLHRFVGTNIFWFVSPHRRPWAAGTHCTPVCVQQSLVVEPYKWFWWVAHSSKYFWHLLVWPLSHSGQLRQGWHGLKWAWLLVQTFHYSQYHALEWNPGLRDKL